jgi:hypothetical protein
LQVRKVMQTLGFLGPAFFLTQLSNVTSISGAVLCMMGAQGFDAFSQSGLYSNHQDIGPRWAGRLLGPGGWRSWAAAGSGWLPACAWKWYYGEGAGATGRP